jgi:FkbM family methyltransferase
MNLQDVVCETLAKLDRRFDLAEHFIGALAATNRYAIGKNDDTLRVNELVALDGVIDDYSDGASTWSGIPVVRTHDVPKDALIVNCSTSISPVSVLKHLCAAGLTHVIGLHELVAASRGALAWPNFVRKQRAELEEHIHAWTRIFVSLHDSESRQTFLDVVRFRISCDPHYMREYVVRIQEQYFEDFMHFGEDVFVDAGGFDGDTSEIFAARYPDYKKIIFFEPSVKNMAAARIRLAGCRDIDFRPIGLSDAAGTLNFNEDAGSAASVTKSIGSMICVDTLDSAILDPVTFIKMDLEGWEMNALQGSRRHILHDRPKLAIAVYHDAPDFRLVHEFIGRFGHNYDVYLRHYTQGWSETIMFFV